MKKIIYLILTITAVFFLSGCEDFLDIKPVGRVIPETAEDYRKLLNNAYSSFPDDFSKIVFATDQYHLLEDAGDYEIYKNYITWNYKGESNSLPLNWRMYYKVIFECNDIIEKQNGIKDGKKEEIKQLVGEAYALRGYTHFILANLYAPAYGKTTPGETPAIPLRLDTRTDIVPEQNTLEEVYQQVIADLQTATEFMTQDVWEGSNKYRLSKAAGYGLLSRVYLYMEDWENVINAGNKALALSGTLTDLNITAEAPNHYQQSENLWSLHYGVNSTALTFLKVHNKISDYFTVT
ncbi:MAG TPA: RagB/SusD family nutrient uptake outer membrane protein, partial [Bacteroidales bacterium]|nr:RagB/SusD family nutrient uptake outer membrane protein [Bacteroidales bacterium]